MIVLTYVREKAGMTMEQLGEKLGVSKQTLSLWEGEKSKIPDKRIDELYDLFKVKKSYFQKELDEVMKLKVDQCLLNYEIEVMTNNNEDYGEKWDSINRQLSDIINELDRIDIIKTVELRLKNKNNFEAYLILNALLDDKFKGERAFNKKVIYDTISALKDIYLYDFIEDDFTKALYTLLSKYQDYLNQVSELMKKTFGGEDPFENEPHNPLTNRFKMDFSNKGKK
jgi:transcriptional regulator with XRE-family HTH domain